METKAALVEKSYIQSQNVPSQNANVLSLEERTGRGDCYGCVLLLAASLVCLVKFLTSQKSKSSYFKSWAGNSL